MSRKIYPRRIAATFCPVVSEMIEGQRVIVKTAGNQGHQHYIITASLSIYTASRLIVDLRKALRAIRAESARHLDEQVSNAEKPL